MIEVQNNSLGQYYIEYKGNVETVRKIKSIVTNNFIDDLDYKFKSALSVSPFVQGYSEEEGEEIILVEFWSKNIENIKMYVKYIEVKVFS